MDRITCEVRPNWQKRVEETGLVFHTLHGETYWDESVYYQFSSYQIDQLELATQTLHDMCIELVEEIIEKRQFGLFMIPKEWENWIIESWEREDPSIYGRFDLAYDGVHPPKLLEYNADTPTALLEAAVTQWYWLKDFDERADQFNSIHENLIEGWKAIHERNDTPLYFAAMASLPEDYVTVEYLRDTAIQAGFETHYLDIEQIGFNYQTNRFVHGDSGEPIEHLFKLYPWEWLIREEYGKFLQNSPLNWIEPPWKMLLSCKSILPLLWEKYPNHPYLLEASFQPLAGRSYRKPIHAREGANIALMIGDQVENETAGPYDGPYVYQQIGPIKQTDGYFAVIGSWVIYGTACGIGIREDSTQITQNTSRFVPHQLVN